VRPTRFVAASDQALLVRFAGEAAGAGAEVRALAAAIAAAPIEGLLHLQPAYASLLVRFDPLATDFARLAAAIEERLALAAGERRGADPNDTAGREIEIPVAYGGEHGPDLDAVAARAGLTSAAVVAAHAAAVYRVEFFGFVAGFGYLSGLPTALATPRLASPRSRVPAGSVAIGGAQCAIYPAETPGGWRLLGRTPLRPARFGAEPWTLFAPGDRLRFVPIDAARFARLSEWP
jgi:KipI family sensor histidine kinase inhibitor